MYSVVIFLNRNLRYHKIRNWRNGFYFTNDHFIIVHLKTVLNTIDTKMVFDEIWYIVDNFIVDIFFFLVVFDLKNQDKNNIYTSKINSA